MIRAVFKGSGSALPPRVMSNEELAQLVDTSDEWIRERTGITARHIAGEGETTGTVEDTEGGREVPSVLLEPVAIFRDNVKDVVDDEFVSADDLCTGEFAQACTELGIE